MPEGIEEKEAAILGRIGFQRVFRKSKCVYFLIPVPGANN